MMQIHVDKGIWYYTVTADKGVALRARCTFSESSKIGKGPLKGTLCEVTQRARAGETTFLKLKDESGWIFDLKNGRRIVDGPIDMQVLPPFSMGTVREQGIQDPKKDGIHLLSSPTRQRWATTKFFLMKGSKVKASMACEVEYTRWVFVSKGEGGGIEGWTPVASLVLEMPAQAGPPKAPTEAPALLNTSAAGSLAPAQAWESRRREEETNTLLSKAPSHGYSGYGNRETNATTTVPSLHHH
jgi:hypothetical protein